MSRSETPAQRWSRIAGYAEGAMNTANAHLPVVSRVAAIDVLCDEMTMPRYSEMRLLITEARRLLDAAAVQRDVGDAHYARRNEAEARRLLRSALEKA